MIDEKFRKYEPFFGKWKISKELGKGSFGQVFEIYWEDDLGSRSTSALKVIHIPSEEALKIQIEEQPNIEAVRNYFLKQVDRIKDEIRILQKCKCHCNFVRYEDLMIVENVGKDEIGWDILIRMELLYPLNPYFSRSEATQYDIIQMWLDITNALIYCEEQNIIHRDIKPANILLSASGRYKLSDFGVARKSMQDTDASTRVGTERYMAPEVFKNQKYDKRADYYSLGCVIYYFLNKRRHVFLPPYPQEVEAEDNERAEKKRISGEKIPRINDVSREINEVLQKSMAYRPTNRYKSARELYRAIQNILETQGSELKQKYLSGEAGSQQASSVHAKNRTDSNASKGSKMSRTGKGSKPSKTFVPIAMAGVLLVTGVSGVIYGVYAKNRSGDPSAGLSEIGEQARLNEGIDSSMMPKNDPDMGGLPEGDQPDLTENDQADEVVGQPDGAEEQQSESVMIQSDAESEIHLNTETENQPDESTEISSDMAEGQKINSTVDQLQGAATNEKQTEPVTEKQTEPVTEKQTEPVTEKQTEPVTEEQTEPVTEKQTEPVTEKQTEPVTEKQTEPVTEKQTEPVTEKQTEPVTEKQTEPVTEKQTEPVTEKQTEPETEKQTDPVKEKQTEPVTEIETEIPVPTTPALGKLERPGDGDTIDKDIKIKGWILTNDSVGDIEAYVDLVSGQERLLSLPLDQEDMGEKTLEKRQKKYAADIAATRGYEIKSNQSVEELSDGDYELQLRIVHQDSGEEDMLEAVKVHISGGKAKKEGDVLDFMGVTEEEKVLKSYYIDQDKGFAIGVDEEEKEGEEETEILANANQILLTGWINAKEGTSVGMYLDIDNQIYTADILEQQGGSFDIIRVPRYLELMDKDLIGPTVQDMEEAGCIIRMQLPFLDEGKHTIGISFNVGVPGEESELVDIKPVNITIDPTKAVKEEEVEKITTSWEEEFPEPVTEASTDEEDTEAAPGIDHENKGE